MLRKATTMWVRFLECFRVALKLGLISFGGPVAHLGYFQREYVEKLKWLGTESFAELLALCQIIPGPASSQLGAAIGYERGGLPGALGAWLGFTFPSALLLGGLGLGWGTFAPEAFAAVVPALIAVTAAVVALATLQLGQKLCQDTFTLLMAVMAGGLSIAVREPLIQPVLILLAGVCGVLVRLAREPAAADTKRFGLKLRPTVALLAFLFLLGVSVLAGSLTDDSFLTVQAGLYRAGALVFGGGHVVLPLLEGVVVGPGAVPSETFLAGYGAAQAVPGPLFTFGSFLGAVSGGWVGFVLGTVLIFLPGMLLLAAFLPYRRWLAGQTWATGAVAGAGAAVVGLLAAALFDLLVDGLQSPGWQVPVALVCFVVLLRGWVPVWLLVLLAAVGGGVYGVL